MKNYYQLGMAVTSIILIIAGVIALGSLAFITYERIKNANESIANVSKETLINTFEQIVVDWTNWRLTLQASAFESDPLEQYEYNLPIEEEIKVNTNINVNENLNQNLNTNTAISLTVDWLSYSNKELGIGFKYPTNWGEVQASGYLYDTDIMIGPGARVGGYEGRATKVKFSNNRKIWLLAASNNFTTPEFEYYNGLENLSEKCEEDGLLDENYTSICKNIEIDGQNTYENIVVLGNACSAENQKEVRLITKSEKYPGLYIALSLPSSQLCENAEEDNKEARKTDLENLYNRANLEQETLNDIINFDLFKTTIEILEQTDTNTNVNTNLNNNINENTNVNENTNQNINLNTNTNTNENSNENLNQNLNLNANTNENVNLNENANTNISLNINVNQNLNQNVNENTNTSPPVEKPKPTDEDKWYKKVKDGTLVFQANWYCSAAGMRIYPHEPSAPTDDIGRWHGDCTNSSVQVKGNFKPVILGEYKKGEKISFRLESDLYKVYETVYTNVQDKCHIDYFPFSGRKDVPAIQYTCDDGYDIGLWDDIQFTVFVFPKGSKIDIPEVISKEEVDSDSDGLTDQEEFKLGTNRIQFDTDGDGYSDKTEVDNGYDPLTAAPTPNPDPETFEKKYYYSIPKPPGVPLPSDDMDIIYLDPPTSATLYSIESNI